MYPHPPVLVVQQRPTSGTAVASMVLGIVGLLVGCCSFGIPSILAVVLGHVAMGETKTNAKSGHGMATAGLVTGYIGVLPAVLLSIWIVLGAGIGAVTGTPVPATTP